MPDRTLTCSRAGTPPRPAQPAWFHRLDEILTRLRAMKSTHLDRLAVEKLFRVRQHLLGDLSAGIALRPGELRIAFGGAEDLAAKLF